MTLFGPDKIIECPNCMKLARVSTLISANTFRARFWTDGRMIAPGLPERPAITKCSGCEQYFWISDAKEASENFFFRWDRKREKERFDEWCGIEVPYAGRPEDDEDYHQEWKDAKMVRKLNEAEYLEAISLHVFSGRKQELALRRMAWWTCNDRFRLLRESPVYKPTSIPLQYPEEKANLERLLELLVINPAALDNDGEILMKAEIMRELGLFDDAVALLNRFFPAGENYMADFMRFIAEHHDCVVREIG